MNTATRLTTALMTVAVGAAAWLICAPVQAQERDEPVVQQVVITAKRLTAEERAALAGEAQTASPVVQRVEVIGRRMRPNAPLPAQPVVAALR